MRWILLGFLAGMLSAQDPRPIPTPAEQLRQEMTKLKQELEQLREVNRLKDEIEAAKRALAEAKLSPRARAKLATKRAREEKKRAQEEKKRKPASKRKPGLTKRASKEGVSSVPVGWIFRPLRVPNLRIGEITVLQDTEESWWTVHRPYSAGFLCLQEFAKGKRGKTAAEKFATDVRADQKRRRR